MGRFRIGLKPQNVTYLGFATVQISLFLQGNSESDAGVEIIGLEGYSLTFSDMGSLLRQARLRFS